MKRVIFVDDEPNVLHGLRRMLRPMRDAWDMNFVESGEDALRELAGQPCDVIVSDVRMKGMDGVTLLCEVMDRYPDTVRIALSGHADYELALECVRATHQYLAKPSDADTIKATIDRACSLRELLTDPALQKLLASMGTLPSLPTLYSDVMSAARDGESVAAIGNIIGRDVAMTAKVLKIVNSAFFGLKRHIESVSQAATLLGIDALRSLVLTSEVFQRCAGSSVLDLEALWAHSAQVGAVARAIAVQERAPAKIRDFAQMAGMLHDVGKLVLATQLPEKYAQAAALRREEGLSDREAEKRVFEHTHTEVGAYLLGLWGLPNPIVEAAAYHHAPASGSGSMVSPLSCVHAANALVHALERGLAPEQAEVDITYLAGLGLEDRLPVWASLLNDIDEVAA